MQNNVVHVCAFYKFLSLSDEVLSLMKEALERCAEEQGVRGLLVAGHEGINATVAGPSAGISEFKAELCRVLSIEAIECKDSYAEKIPFARFKIDIRPEIITTKDETISADESFGTHLTPAEWHKMLESDPDVVVVDTRNDYETEIGVFENAIDPKIRKFSDFQKFIEEGNLPRDKKLLMYCTGGIRCEKAVPEVKRLGYDNVYQLSGGILRYLEEFPNGYFKGECFVFDHRVAVDQNLQPTKTYKLCPHCGNTARTAISCVECGGDAVVCEKCLAHTDKRTCSKNCAYHVRRKGERAAA